MAGVTDRLIRAVRAATESGDFQSELSRVSAIHEECARSLLGEASEAVMSVVRGDLTKLGDVLRAVALAKTFTLQTQELVSGFGELWSAQMLHALLRKRGVDVDWIDARDVLVVEQGTSGPALLWARTRDRFDRCFETLGNPAFVVVTGYIASDTDGVPRSLGRNGSDYSASIVASLLHAGEITIWTDVDGVMSADPRRVPDAVLLSELSFDEALELANFGAKVLHPHTMAPAIEDGIAIRIRNSRAPTRPGTLLSAAPSGGDRVVKGFSTSDGLALLELEGVRMMGVPGISSRLFQALREVGVSVALISQTVSEHTICVGLPMAQGQVAKEAVERAFHAELHHGEVQRIGLSSPYTIVAAVGDRMVNAPGVSGRFFTALGKAGINVRAIAQGSSERNISAVVAQDDSTRALRAVHSAFYLSDQTLSVGIIGPGRVGAALLRQIQARAEGLHRRHQINLRVRGIMRSRTMRTEDKKIDLAHWQDGWDDAAVPADLGAFVEHVRAPHLPHAVIVDCTATESLNEYYPRWLDAGIHVVTPNKHATAASMELYREIRRPDRRTHYLGETTVGAGLPVLRTLRDLIRTGDRVRRIEGILSGTLSYLFGAYQGGSFADLVRDAHERGFTEPDPREDLTGNDVARKALILAREMGLAIEAADCEVENLVPAALRDAADGQEFLARLGDHDNEFEAQWRAARERGEVLRYVAVIDASGSVEVGLRGYSKEHAFARIAGGDNVMAFSTDRYDEYPMIIQGPGAGPEVTAAGIFRGSCCASRPTWGLRREEVDGVCSCNCSERCGGV